MKEVRRIVSARVTLIELVSDEGADKIVSCKQDAEKNVANTLKQLYFADDVKVQIQDFVADVGDKGAE